VNRTKKGAGCIFNLPSCLRICHYPSPAINFKPRHSTSYFAAGNNIKIFSFGLFGIKINTTKDFIVKQVLSHNQLLKNKWYYVLHSTK
jgi:hypothetical protein